MLSDDKISHISHILLRDLNEKGFISPKTEDHKIRREIKNTITSQLKISEEINEKVRAKLKSFSKNIPEGTPEWEILYEKFYREEEGKKGLV